MSNRRLIERYVVRTIFPYVLAAFALSTGILFVQQSGRYLETIFHNAVPAAFTYSIALAVLPTVLTLTVPMAVLAGTVIGFGRLGSDSELIAMQAGGISRRQIILPAKSNDRSEEHTSELQSHSDLVCRLLLEKKKKKKNEIIQTKI